MNPPSLDHLVDLLPQRPPFRFVDRVVSLDEGPGITAEVDFPAGHRVFEGHLPDEPLVPGVILIEAMAQAAGLALAGGEAGGRPIHGYLAEVGRIRFKSKVGPDSTVTLKARLGPAFGAIFRFEVRAECVGELVAEGEITVAASKVD